VMVLADAQGHRVGGPDGERERGGEEGRDDGRRALAPYTRAPQAIRTTAEQSFTA
jgi:hypothetical protein